MLNGKLEQDTKFEASEASAEWAEAVLETGNVGKKWSGYYKGGYGSLTPTKWEYNGKIITEVTMIITDIDSYTGMNYTDSSDSSTSVEGKTLIFYFDDLGEFEMSLSRGYGYIYDDDLQSAIRKSGTHTIKYKIV